MWHVLLVAMLGATSAQMDPQTMQARHSSFANEPLIEGGRLEQMGGDLRLALTARFANECLASAGVDAETIDLPTVSSEKGASLRVVLLRQRIKPDGCPDSFMPVSKSLQVPVTATDRLRTIVLLNTSSAFSNVSDGLRAHRFGVSDAAPRSSDTSGQPITVTDMSKSAFYPVLQNVQVIAAGRTSQARRYSVDFEIVAPAACQARQPLVELRESSGAPNDPSTEMQDWFTVSIPGGAPCSRESDQVVGKKYRVTTEIVAEGKRRLVIVNRVAGGNEVAEKLFSVIELK